MRPFRPALAILCVAFLVWATGHAWLGSRWLRLAATTPLEQQGSVRFKTVGDLFVMSSGLLTLVAVRLGHALYVGRPRPRLRVRMHPAARRAGTLAGVRVLGRRWPRRGVRLRARTRPR